MSIVCATAVASTGLVLKVYRDGIFRSESYQVVCRGP